MFNIICMNILIFGFGNRARSYILKSILIAIENPKITVVTKKSSPNKEQFPKIPTSVYGNHFPNGYEKAIASISEEAIVEAVQKAL